MFHHPFPPLRGRRATAVSAILILALWTPLPLAQQSESDAGNMSLSLGATESAADVRIGFPSDEATAAENVGPLKEGGFHLRAASGETYRNEQDQRVGVVAALGGTATSTSSLLESADLQQLKRQETSQFHEALRPGDQRTSEARGLLPPAVEGGATSRRGDLAAVSGSGAGLDTLWPIAAVLGLIGLAFAAAKRLGLTSRMGGVSELQVVARLALGPRHHVAVVRLPGGRSVLVGLGPNSVEFLGDVGVDRSASDVGKGAKGVVAAESCGVQSASPLANLLPERPRCGGKDVQPRDGAASSTVFQAALDHAIQRVETGKRRLSVGDEAAGSAREGNAEASARLRSEPASALGGALDVTRRELQRMLGRTQGATKRA